MCSKRLVGSILLALVFTVGSARGGLVHHWTLDKDGTDAVGGLNGTVQGPVVVPGMVDNGLLFDGQDDSVEFTDFVPPLRGTIVLWLNASNVQSRGRFLGSVDQFEAYVQNQIIANQLFSAGSLPNYIVSSTMLTTDTWYHVALIYDGMSHLQQIYINGQLDAEDMTADDPWGGGNFAFGHRAGQNQQFYNGILDDVRIYDHVLTQEEIQQLMKGVPPGAAFDPSPDNGATDVPRDVVLSWRPGKFAPAVNGHRVYFSEGFTDVNDGVGGSTHSASSYDPGRLDFETTYYWRVDEVNAPPDSTVFPGEVWSFTTEPVGYPIDGMRITATASSSSQADFGPENTVNGSGLDPNGLHSTDATDMWLSGDEPLGAWIQYEFDKVYKLHQMWVWNSNQQIEAVLGFGFKDVAVEYSTDGAEWTALVGVPEFTQAPGAADYAHNTTVDFGGAVAKYVRLTSTSNWGGILAQYGLSEVRFFSIPVSAREPSPDRCVPQRRRAGCDRWHRPRYDRDRRQLQRSPRFGQHVLLADR
ncbi:MAG: LamG-like jellyroll fold domain-containing protein [Planctomycetota bacterium]